MYDMEACVAIRFRVLLIASWLCNLGIKLVQKHVKTRLY